MGSGGWGSSSDRQGNADRGKEGHRMVVENAGITGSHDTANCGHEPAETLLRAGKRWGYSSVEEATLIHDNL